MMMTKHNLSPRSDVDLTPTLDNDDDNDDDSSDVFMMLIMILMMIMTIHNLSDQSDVDLTPTLGLQSKELVHRSPTSMSARKIYTKDSC